MEHAHRREALEVGGDERSRFPRGILRRVREPKVGQTVGDAVVDHLLPWNACRRSISSGSTWKTGTGGGVDVLATAEYLLATPAHCQLCEPRSSIWE